MRYCMRTIVKKEHIVSLYLVWAIFLLWWFNALTFAVTVPSCLVLPLNLTILPFSFWGWRGGVSTRPWHSTSYSCSNICNFSYGCGCRYSGASPFVSLLYRILQQQLQQQHRKKGSRAGWIVNLATLYPFVATCQLAVMDFSHLFRNQQYRSSP